MPSPILIIGSFIQDLTFHVSRFPAPGETLLGDFVTGPGGKGSNQAIAAARTGVPTAFAGAVGNDAFGDGAEKFHAAEGIEHHFLRMTDAPTGTAGISVNAQGQNHIIVALGASGRFGSDAIEEKWILDAEVVVLQFEIAPKTVASLLERSHRLGRTTILNPAPMNDTVDLGILKNVDILIPNESEFAAIARRHPAIANPMFTEELLATLPGAELHALCRQTDVPTVIVTLGKRGCLVSQPTGFEVIPILSGVDAVDTTGAGDAFVGGFASGLVRFKGDIPRAARFGSVVAGLSVTKRGAALAMPQKAEIEAAWARFSHSALRLG
ncbi:MAG TPA: ribokinase [Chthoniobacterales bacterium]